MIFLKKINQHQRKPEIKMDRKQELIESIISGDETVSEESFRKIMASKISDLLEQMRKEIGSKLLTKSE